jgi:glycosyltransferase involved in cell wall biosynthesis
MKIAHFTDTNRSAIYRLACGISSPKLECRVADFHPKKPSPSQVKRVKDLFRWADIVHVQYWKTGAKIREIFPEWSAKPKILTHYNPYNLHEEDWSDYQQLIVVNQTQHKELPQATLIPLCTDLNFFKFQKGAEDRKVVHMAVNRIEGKKGISFVAQACSELGYQFQLVGRVSKPKYLQECREIGGKHMNFRENVSEQQLRQAYYEAGVHVCNSVDGFESGTLPILESMACGVPVISRNIGHVSDLYTGSNLKLLTGPPKDVEGIKTALQGIMNDKETTRKMIQEGTSTVGKRDYPTWSMRHLEVYRNL